MVQKSRLLYPKRYGSFRPRQAWYKVIQFSLDKIKHKHLLSEQLIWISVNADYNTGFCVKSKKM